MSQQGAGEDMTVWELIFDLAVIAVGSFAIGYGVATLSKEPKERE